MKKTLWLVLSVMLAAAFVLSACAKPTPTPTTPPPAQPTQPPAQPTKPPAPEKVTLSFWEQEGEEVDVFLDQLIAEFEAANPDINVERTHYENEALRDQFQTAALAEAAPEVVRVPNDFAGPFSALDIIAPVDQLFDKAFLDQFFPGSLQPAIVKGVLWGVPDNYGNHLMLLYNKEPHPPGAGHL
jgi:arabinogalactan oligomer/maltooligosaccharide transport system substrate-binding protein